MRASADTEDEQEATLRGPSPETVAEVSAPAISVSHTLVVPIGLQEPRIGAPAVGVTGGVIRASVVVCAKQRGTQQQLQRRMERSAAIESWLHKS